jgi:CheY-like chemotaxis protein
MTGYGRQQDRDASMAAGFDHYLVKPVGLAALLPLIGASATSANAAAERA